MGAQQAKVNVLILGLEGAGKTTLLYRLRLHEQFSFEVTNGFNYEVVSRVYDKTRFEFHMWDLAGRPELRPLWKHYYTNLNPDVVLFVVDANDKEKLVSEAQGVLHRLLHEESLHGSLKIVLSNVKRDKDESMMGKDEVREALKLNKRDQAYLRNTRVIEINAQRGDGFEDFLNHICKSVLRQP